MQIFQDIYLLMPLIQDKMNDHPRQALQIEYLQRLRYKEESIVDQSLYDILELIMLFDFGEEDETYIKSDEVHLLTRIFKFLYCYS